jgi:hypothetical protein
MEITMKKRIVLSLLAASSLFADAQMDAIKEQLQEQKEATAHLEAKLNSLEQKSTNNSTDVNIGMIGAGNFAKIVMLPILKESNSNLVGISSAKGLSGSISGKKFGFRYSTTDYQELLKDENINTIFITTRHNNHAQLIIESLEAGKNVFVEKPLAIDMQQLADVLKVCNKLAKENKMPKLMVGFNRRFSPFIKDIYNKTKGRSSGLAMNMTINAGALPKDLLKSPLNSTLSSNKTILLLIRNSLIQA